MAQNYLFFNIVFYMYFFKNLMDLAKFVTNTL